MIYDIYIYIYIFYVCTYMHIYIYMYTYTVYIYIVHPLKIRSPLYHHTLESCHGLVFFSGAVIAQL